MGGNLDKVVSVSVPVVKAPTPRRMFVDRMKLEGRYKDWIRICKEVRAERIAAGQQPHMSSEQNATMKRMGYQGPKEERALYEKRQAQVHLSAEQKEKREIKQEKAVAKALLTFEQTVAALKENAPDQVELDWIRAHPAMARASRDTEKKLVVIEVGDIKNAPSRSAVFALQHWVNHTSEFYKQTMSEQKKREDGGGSSGDFSRCLPLNDAKRILNGMRSGSGITTEELGPGRGEPGTGLSDEAGVLSGGELQDPLPDTEE